MKPPRALWVPFYLGRPFGVPDDPDFQRNVLRAALDLLPTLTEHGIVDYPVEAPDDSFSHTWACPVSFEASDADSLGARLRGEAQRLAPWWRETHRARGRTLVGASAPLPDGPDREVTVPQHVDTLAAALVDVAEGAPLDTPPVIEQAGRLKPRRSGKRACLVASDALPAASHRAGLALLLSGGRGGTAGRTGAVASRIERMDLRRDRARRGDHRDGPPTHRGRRPTPARACASGRSPRASGPTAIRLSWPSPGTDPLALADQANKLFAPRQ